MACCKKSEGKMECQSTEILSKILADTYCLLLKTQNVHWNYTGCGFMSIHLMTDSHYNDLFSAIDEIAERIRMVCGRAPATFEEYSKLASFSEKLESEEPEDMIKELLKAHLAICEDLRKGIETLSASGDHGTIDVLNGRLCYHEKIVWMLHSSICDCGCCKDKKSE